MPRAAFETVARDVGVHRDLSPFRCCRALLCLAVAKREELAIVLTISGPFGAVERTVAERPFGMLSWLVFFTAIDNDLFCGIVLPRARLPFGLVSASPLVDVAKAEYVLVAAMNPLFFDVSTM